MALVVTMMGMWWDRFVDFVTVIWLGVFAVGFVAPSLIPSNTQLILLAVFVGDLGVKFRRDSDPRTFLRRRWFDILMVIPYFRIFRILKLVRMLRFLRIMKLVRTLQLLKTLEGCRRKVTRIARSVRKSYSQWWRRNYWPNRRS
ncbi:MAG: ion transporter [Chloroflexi bacterium]|nr:ion transporter [Chloroflexota bacterium]